MSKAADCIAQVDFVEEGIMSGVNWSLLSIHIEPNERGSTGCGQDVRQVLHHLSMVGAAGGGADGGKMESGQAKKEA